MSLRDYPIFNVVEIDQIPVIGQKLTTDNFLGLPVLVFRDEGGRGGRSDPVEWGKFDVGEDFNVDGVAYTIDTVNSYGSDHKFETDTTTNDHTGRYFTHLQLSNENGIRHFAVLMEPSIVNPYPAGKLSEISVTDDNGGVQMTDHDFFNSDGGMELAGTKSEGGEAGGAEPGGQPTGAKTAIYDAILLDTEKSISDGTSLTTELAGVSDDVTVASEIAALSTGENATITIDGTVYTVDVVQTATADITYADGASSAKAAAITILEISAGGKTQKVIFTPDGQSYDKITEIEIKSPPKDGSFLISDGSSNDTVSIGSPPPPPPGTVNDVIVVDFAGPPGNGTVWTTEAGELEFALDDVEVGLADAGIFKKDDFIELPGGDYQSTGNPFLADLEVTYLSGGVETTATWTDANLAIVHNIAGGPAKIVIFPDDPIDAPYISSIKIVSGITPNSTGILIEEVDDDDDVTLATTLDDPNYTIHDLILFSGSTPFSTGQTATTLAGDMVRVVDEIVYSNDPDSMAGQQNLMVGSVVNFEGTIYTVTSITTHEPYINYDVGDNDANAPADLFSQIVMTADDGTQIMVGAFSNGTDGVDFPRISSIDFLSEPSPAITEIAPTELDNNDFVTLDSESQKMFFDLIELNVLNPGSGTTLTVYDDVASTGEMVAVHDDLTVLTQASFNQLSVNDTVDIAGNTFTVQGTYKFNTDIMLDDEFGIPTELENAVLTVINLDDGAGNVKSYLLPNDLEGDLPEISEIELKSTLGGTNQPVNLYDDATDLDHDQDDHVTLKLDGSGIFVYDAIRVRADAEAINNEDVVTWTNKNGEDDLETVSDTIELLDDGPIEINDIIYVNGVQVVVDDLRHDATADIDHLSPIDGSPVTTEDVPISVLQYYDNDGVLVRYIIPQDDAGHLPQISEIRSDFSGILGNQIPYDHVDEDQVVTIATEATPPIHDLILLGTDLPTEDGTILNSGPGELEDVKEPITFYVTEDGDLEPGANAWYNGVLYTIEHTDLASTTFTFDNGSGPQTQDVDVALIKMVGVDGSEVSFTIPMDVEGTLLKISSIEYNSIGQDGEIKLPIGSIESNEAVTLDLPVAIHDLILFNVPDVPTAGEFFTTNNDSAFGNDTQDGTELVHVKDDMIVVTQADPNKLSQNDVLSYQGQTYTVTAINDANVDITQNGTTDGNLGFTFLTLTNDTTGEVEIYGVPDDSVGDYPEINAISVNTVSGSLIETDLDTLDTNDEIDIGYQPEIEPTFGQYHWDFIEISDPALAVYGQTLTTLDGDLTAVIEPVRLTTATTHSLQANDTVWMNGQNYEVASTQLLEFEVEFEPTLEHPTGKATVLGARVTIDEEAPGTGSRSFLTIFDSEDQTGSYDTFTEGLPQITSITLADPMILGSVELVKLNKNENITLAGEETTQVFDFIQISDMPAAGETFTSYQGSGEGDLIAIQEALNFNVQTQGEISLGDTVVIAGKVWYVSATDQFRGVAHEEEGNVQTDIKGALIELKTEAGETLTMAAPYDTYDNLPRITQIEFTALDDTVDPDIEVVNIDFDDIVTLICFGEGTKITTPYGEVPVETLKVGDAVITADAGPQYLRWIGSRTVSARDEFAPVKISEGTFGVSEDLYLSPNHRVVLTGWEAELLFGDPEVLVPAKFLVNDSTVSREPSETVTYYHLLFDTHHIVYSNGIRTESFHPGREGMRGLAEETREEIYELFPDLRDDPEQGFGASCRLALNKHEAVLLNQISLEDLSAQ